MSKFCTTLVEEAASSGWIDAVGVASSKNDSASMDTRIEAEVSTLELAVTSCRLDIKEDTSAPSSGCDLEEE
jgi:hypothetical protein